MTDLPITGQPWEVIRKAADKLAELAAKATPGPWTTSVRRYTVFAGRKPVADYINAATGDPEWIATLSPVVAEPLVSWLRFEAVDCQVTFGTGGDTPSTRKYLAERYAPALDFARLILGGDHG